MGSKLEKNGQNSLHVSRRLSREKVDIEETKVDIRCGKVDIESALAEKGKYRFKEN